MPNTQPQPRTLILGATGFLGRWLTLELLHRGEPVAAAVRGGRDSAGDRELRQWLRGHGANNGTLTTVATDITRPGLGLSAADDARLGAVRDIHNLAALYRFGLGRAEAEAANVDGALHALHWAASRPGLRRLVHLSGYRVGRDASPRHPLPAAETDALYARLGAYEASKQLGDAAVRVSAHRLGVPLTTVNPSSVIGHSVTGEAGQYIGPAELVRQLWRGRLPALPGTARTFLPVVAVDYLAGFLAAVPEFDQGPAHAHAVLDPATPHLPDLIALLAEHLGVPAPRRLVPVGLVRRLPRALTGADPETLSFLSEDTYSTASADHLAAAAGLVHPPVADLLRRWSTRLVADRFGAGPPTTGAHPNTAARTTPAPAPAPARATPATPRTTPTTPHPGDFTTIAGSRTYLTGERYSPGYVLLHGPGEDADAWHPAAERLDAPALLADLPGLARSSPAAMAPGHWLAELLAQLRSRPVLVGHAAGAAPVLRYAAAHPGQVAGLVLIAPPFLQPRTRTASPPLAAATATDRDQAHRPGADRRAAQWIRHARRPAERAALVGLLHTCPVPVLLVVGESDGPLEHPGSRTVPGDGRHLRLLHPEELAQTITEFGRTLDR